MTKFKLLLYLKEVQIFHLRCHLLQSFQTPHQSLQNPQTVPSCLQSLPFYPRGHMQRSLRLGTSELELECKDPKKTFKTEKTKHSDYLTSNVLLPILRLFNAFLCLYIALITLGVSTFSAVYTIECTRT